MKRILELLQTITQEREITEVSLKEAAGWELALALYGGEKGLGKIPLTREILRQVVIAPGQNHVPEPTLLQRPQMERNVLCDGIVLKPAVIRDGMLEAGGICSFGKKMEMIDQWLLISSGLELIKADYSGEADAGFGMLSANIPWDTGEMPEIYYVVCWYREEGNFRMQICRQGERQDSREDGKRSTVLSETVQSIFLDFPRSQDYSDSVNVAYGRTVSGYENVVKAYPFEIQNNCMKFYLDFCGGVTLKSGDQFQDLNRQRFFLRVITTGGMADYRKTDRMDEIAAAFSPTGTGLHFELDNDWGCLIPLSQIPSQHEVFLMGEAGILLSDGAGHIKEADLIFGHDWDTVGNMCHTPGIRLLYGCIAMDTEIELADGSVRKAGEIRIGDEIHTGNGTSGQVERIWKGTRKEMVLHIETGSGAVLLCTDMHPIVTKDGIKRAKDLNAEDLLLDGHGKFMDITAIYPDQKEKVVNFDIKGTKHLMVCNGILTGDNICQNQELVLPKAGVGNDFTGERRIKSRNAFRKE